MVNYKAVVSAKIRVPPEEPPAVNSQIDKVYAESLTRLGLARNILYLVRYCYVNETRIRKSP
jgi:hypothetical protein